MIGRGLIAKGVVRRRIVARYAVVLLRLEDEHLGQLAGAQERPPFVHGPANATAIRDLAARRGLDLMTWSAYSDSINDKHLLSAVGDAQVANPDRHIARLSRQRAWTVHRHYGLLRRACRHAATLVTGRVSASTS